jgi:hypothetical protein
MKFLLNLIGLNFARNGELSCRFCLYYGGNSAGGRGDSSESNTSSDSSTKVTTNNQQVGASEGSQAFGANSTVNIESSDAKVITAAGAIINNAVTNTNDTVKTTTKDALNFGSDALNTVGKTVEQANGLLSRTFETYAGNLKDNSGVSGTTVADNMQKYALYAVVAIVVGFVGVKLSNTNTK